MMTNNSQPKKRRSLFRSFRDAFRGIWDTIKSERNMRIHVVTCVYVLFFASRIGLTRGEFACLCLAIGSVITAEMLNTSLEKLCDFAQKSTNRLIRIIKDMAAGAVLVCAFFAALVGVVVLFRPALWEVLVGICTAPPSLLLLLLSLAIAAVFVFVGPQRLTEKAQSMRAERKEHLK